MDVPCEIQGNIHVFYLNIMCPVFRVYITFGFTSQAGGFLFDPYHDANPVLFAISPASDGVHQKQSPAPLGVRRGTFALFGWTEAVVAPNADRNATG